MANHRRRIAVVTPSFISDCLETLFEIGVEYRERFDEAGGEEFQLVPNLNNDAGWFKAVYEIASKHLDFLQERFELCRNYQLRVNGEHQFLLFPISWLVIAIN